MPSHEHTRRRPPHVPHLTWPAKMQAMTTILRADARLHPANAWMLQAVRATDPHSARHCLELATGDAWQPVAAGSQRLRNVRAAAAARGLAINVYTFNRDLVVSDLGMRQARMVTLVRCAGCYHLDVFLKWDDVRGRPVAVSRWERVVMCEFPSLYPQQCSTKGWKQWYFAGDSHVAGAPPWQSWEQQWDSMNQMFGASTVHRDIHVAAVKAGAARTAGRVGGLSPYRRQGEL